jgi:hypothetical protein
MPDSTAQNRSYSSARNQVAGRLRSGVQQTVMRTDDHLPQRNEAASPAILVVPGNHDLPPAERREDGQWYYVGTDTMVPGAADVTLGETANVFEISRRGQPPDAVLVPCAEVSPDSELSWVEQVGVPVRGPEESFFKVPWALWQEQAAAPVGMRAPERDGDPLERLIAVEERELRFARRRVELLTERRARAVANASGDGMTRRSVSDLLGVTPGRVQQLLDEMPPTLRAEVDDLLRDTLKVLREIGSRELAPADVRLPAGRDGSILDELVSFGFLEEDHGTVRVTETGEAAELHLRTKKKSRGSSRG